ncbi:MAG: F0F1 ATP synthase subunit epsilon [Patescibacteria group bacterium]
MKTFHLTVAKVGENLFEGEAISATLPGSEGVFQILAEHEAFVSELKQGEVSIRGAHGELHHFEVSQGGIAEVSRNQATILL